METATSCTKYSQVAGLVHMLGQDCTMMSCYNDILITYSCQDTTIINGYMYTCKMVISSACMEGSAAAMTVFNLYCSHTLMLLLIARIKFSDFSDQHHYR